MHISGSFAGNFFFFENGHMKLKLLRFEVESGNFGQCEQVTIELNSAIVELE